MTQTQVTREDLVRDLKIVVDDLHALSKAAAQDASAKVTAARIRVEQWTKSVQDRLHEVEQQATTQVGQTVKKADAYVHEHPWQSIAKAAEAGLFVGLMLNKRGKGQN